MAKITKRAVYGGTRYSIYGLTFGEIFRIKQAMAYETTRLKEIADECRENNHVHLAAKFDDEAAVSQHLFDTIREYIY